MHVTQGNEVFLGKVTAWQRQLGMVENTLSVWADVQKLWQALESIYTGSADIRAQLPEDSARFAAINAHYQVWLICHVHFFSAAHSKTFGCHPPVFRPCQGT